MPDRFNPREIVIAEFLEYLGAAYRETYGAAEPAVALATIEIARAALTPIARCNALYHDLDHSVGVTQIGIEIMKSRQVRDGDVRPIDWLHVVGALVCFTVGFVPGVVDGDGPDELRIDAEGRMKARPKGATDAWIWPHAIDRAQMFVRRRFASHPLIDAERLCKSLRHGRFPPPEAPESDPRSFAALFRASYYIGSVANPRFFSRLRALFLELGEAGFAAPAGLDSAAKFRAGYVGAFWTHIWPHAKPGVDYLRLTSSGRQWLAIMQAHLLSEQHDVPDARGLSA